MTCVRSNITIMPPECHSERKFFGTKIEVEESRGAKNMNWYKRVYKMKT